MPLPILPATSISIPLKVLQSLLYGFPELDGISPCSPKPGDYARPKIVPTELGVLLEQLESTTVDPTKRLFHVEFLPPTHAEIWHTQEWERSNAKLYKSKAKSLARVEDYETTKTRAIRREKLIELLEDELPTGAWSYDARHKMAINIADNYQRSDLSNILKSLKVYEMIVQFDENQHENHKNGKV